ncbi:MULTISPECIES: lipoprotein [unclassified Flavobacterium]|uniref:lipoprotein n=1 Tax=unclassified Flavobacterium TaxID=196869 RepID=UPI0039C86C86
MKKIISIFFLIVFLTSCGPHRMGCGARGICKTSERQILNYYKINNDTQTVKI